MDADLLRTRILERLAATDKKRVPVSVAIGKGRDYLSNFLNGEKNSIAMEVLPRLAEELECPVEFFIDPGANENLPQASPGEVLLPIRGYVGASPDGRIIFAHGDEIRDYALMPEGATPRSVGLLVNGHSMRGVADEGAIIFFDDQRTPPSPDMLGHVVVVETESGDVLVKRLLKGSRRGVYDLESIVGPTLADQRLRWAAHINSIVPPYRARQIIRTLAA
jgi:transcriptional regulator with XRE-family HTH domain